MQLRHLLWIPGVFQLRLVTSTLQLCHLSKPYKQNLTWVCPALAWARRTLSMVCPTLPWMCKTLASMCSTLAWVQLRHLLWIRRGSGGYQLRLLTSRTNGFMGGRDEMPWKMAETTGHEHVFLLHATQGPLWGYSKVNLQQTCQFLTTISLKMAPRTGQRGLGYPHEGPSVVRRHPSVV